MDQRRRTKYVARVEQVLRGGIHTIGAIVNGEIFPIANLPAPSRVEIELDGERDESCSMCRYTDAGEFCGDTWHESLDAAFEQALFEYGLTASDFRKVEDAQ